MDETQLEQLAQRLNTNILFLQKIRKRFNPKDETELIRISNEIRDIQNQTQANDDDAVEFYSKQLEQQKQPKTPTTQLQRTENRQEQPQYNRQQEAAQIQQPQAQQTLVPQGQTTQETTQPPSQPQATQNVSVAPQPQLSKSGDQNVNKTRQFTRSIFGYDVDTGVAQGAKNAVDIHTGGTNTGEDYFVPTGTELYVPPGEYEVVKTFNKSTDNNPVIGNVKTAKRYENSGYGNQVILKDKQTGEQHRFNHLSEVNLEPGQTVSGGVKMGKTGATGNVVGKAHLDYEIFDKSGKLKSPREWEAFDEQGNLTRQQPEDSEWAKSPQRQKIDQQLPEDQNQQETPQEVEEQPRALTDVEERVVSLLPENQRQAARQALPDIASSLKAEGILNPKTLAYTMATVGAESGFVPKEEIMAQRGLNSRNDYIAGLQDNYSGGKEYRGRGYIQLTHDSNYKKYGDRIGVDLVNNPQLANDPKVAAKVLAAYMKDSGAADAVNKGDYDTARVRVQGRGALNDQFIGKTREIGRQAQQLEQALGDNVDTIFQSKEDPQKDVVGQLSQNQPVGQQTEQQKIEKGVERSDIFSQAAQKAKELVTGNKPQEETGKGFLGIFSSKQEEKTSPDQIKGGENVGIFNQYAENVGTATGSVANADQQQEFQNKLQTGDVLFTPAQKQAQQLKQEQESTFQDPLKRIQNAIQQTASASAQNAGNVVQRGLNIVAPKAQASTAKPSGGQSFSSVRSQQASKAFSTPAKTPTPAKTTSVSKPAASKAPTSSKAPTASKAPIKSPAPVRSPVASSSASVSRAPVMSKAPVASKAPAKSAPAASRVANAVKSVAKKITSLFKR